MNWNADKSVRLSQACVIVFAALLLALDIGCYWAVQWFTGLRQMSKQSAFLMMLTIYLCSIFAWLLLAKLWKLLKNIRDTFGITIVVITHEMRVIQQVCTRVAVLDGGLVQEEGSVADIFAHPASRAAKRLLLIEDEEEESYAG